MFEHGHSLEIFTWRQYFILLLEDLHTRGVALCAHGLSATYRCEAFALGLHDQFSFREMEGRPPVLLPTMWYMKQLSVGPQISSYWGLQTHRWKDEAGQRSITTRHYLLFGSEIRLLTTSLEAILAHQCLSQLLGLKLTFLEVLSDITFGYSPLPTTELAMPLQPPAFSISTCLWIWPIYYYMPHYKVREPDAYTKEKNKSRFPSPKGFLKSA